MGAFFIALDSHPTLPRITGRGLRNRRQEHAVALLGGLAIEGLSMSDSQTPLTTPSPRGREDFAYILPMGVFLAFTFVGTQWPALYPISYILKTVAAGVLLFVGRRAYSRISWDYWQLGVLVGILGIVQWVPMQLWLQSHVRFFAVDPAGQVFNPTTAFASGIAMNAFILFRWIIGASLVVPIMEELFWRDFVWRSILAPSNFKLAAIGERSLQAFFGVAIVFAFVHGNGWLTSIVWAMLIGGLLIYTRSLGACIIAHAVTNFLLGVYVLLSGDWGFW